MNEKSLDFLQLFNQLESELKRRMHKDNYVNFSRLIDEASESNIFIRKNKSLINTLSDLRNVVVHQEGKLVTAIPTDEGMRALESIYDNYTKPKTVSSICKHEVLSILSEQKLDEALRIMGRHGFSQLPVLEEKVFVGILTGNVITRFLASRVDKKGDLVVDVGEIEVSEVLEYQQTFDQVKFIAKDMSTIELVEIITHEPSPTGVYFVTENGQRNEKILSICTHGDFPRIWETL